MRLFWKLFCSMVILTTLACSVGGYILIDGQFRTSLNQEVTALYEENDLLRYTLAREIEQTPGVTRTGLSKLLSGVTITTGRGTVAFRISDEENITIVSIGSMPVKSTELTTKLSDGQRGWRLTRVGKDRIFLHAASPLTLHGSTLYLENCREVTSIFSARTAQYQNFFYLLLALTAAVGMLSLAISAVMLRPLVRLSVATKRMAAGELDQRVPVDRTDELGRLSADFNAMAAQLQTQMQDLEEAKRRREDFMGSFAHEIKTPLTSIIGYADLLYSRPATPEQVQNSAGYIFREGKRLEALSRKLMELIVLDRQAFQMKLVPMKAFLERVGGMMKPVMERSGIQLMVYAEEAQIPLEPDLMETVCLNLLDNARKAMDAGGRIGLQGRAEEDGYCIRVTDSGKGIPSEELDRITEPFYMVDKSRARSQGGAGLGLALCQRIVAIHGGTMQIQSMEGRGTEVSVYLKGDSE